MAKADQHNTPPQPRSITGVEAFQGKGVRQAKGFWEDAWGQVIKRNTARFGLAWIVVVAFFAVFSPLLANGHPLLMWTRTDQGAWAFAGSPLIASLSAADWLLLIGTLAGAAALALPLGGMRRSRKLSLIVVGAIQAGLIAIAASIIRDVFTGRDVSDAMRAFEQSPAFEPVAVLGPALLVTPLFLLIAPLERLAHRAAFVGAVAAVTATVTLLTFRPGLSTFDYADRIRDGELKAVFTAVPWSPQQLIGDRDASFLAPGQTTGTALAENLLVRMPRTGPVPPDALARSHDAAERLPLPEGERAAFLDDYRAWIDANPGPTRNQVADFTKSRLGPLGTPYYVGTTSFGQDVLSQLMHACRLSISIGLVSTGIAVFIGVLMGATMGYFGGWVDLALYRVTEVFMAIPVLFLLIVAAGVLPRNTYVMMAIIGCFTWHYTARFTRAEFFRLRQQDFVQAAAAAGLPIRSILFKHMLPNGVTPVLVDASFRIALAILFEAILSFLGLGPEDQASWGKLLADANSEAGTFQWWLAIFPGVAIFLTVLAYNLIGEAMRDAIDPKLKKARV